MENTDGDGMASQVVLVAFWVFLIGSNTFMLWSEDLLSTVWHVPVIHAVLAAGMLRLIRKAERARVDRDLTKQMYYFAWFMPVLTLIASAGVITRLAP
jgi:hypothetical protein